MWPYLLTAILAVTLTVFQVSFLSHQGAPLSDIFFPIIAISYTVVTGRPILGAIWALIAGFLLDLHGLFAFGIQLGLLFAILAVTRIAFERVLTNASKLAVFLLTALGVFLYFSGLIFVDGIRVLFGSVPYIISFEPTMLTHAIRMAVVNGLIVVVMIATGSYLKKRLAHAFLLHEKF